MKQKEIRVTDILLDTGNYRTGKQDDQREAIKALIEEQKNKLVNLAKDIIENGLSPLETIMVYAVPDEKNRYVVVEGNRRVAAIKLATQPDLAADTTWHNAFKRLHKLLPGQAPKKILCKVAANKEEAFPWIQRRHGARERLEWRIAARSGRHAEAVYCPALCAAGFRAGTGEGKLRER